jgi:hypothetical protein
MSPQIPGSNQLNSTSGGPQIIDLYPWQKACQSSLHCSMESKLDLYDDEVPRISFLGLLMLLMLFENQLRFLLVVLVQMEL